MVLWSWFTLDLPHLPHLEIQAPSGAKQTNKTNHSSLPWSVFGKNKQAFFSCLQTACECLVICSWPGDRLCLLFLLLFYLVHYSYQKVFPSLKSSWLCSLDGMHLSFALCSAYRKTPLLCPDSLYCSCHFLTLYQSPMKPQTHYSAVFSISLDPF